MTAYQGGGSAGSGRGPSMKWVQATQASTVFEFGCGLGDMGRALRRALPECTLNACDMYPPVIAKHQAAPRDPYDCVVFDTIEDSAKKLITGQVPCADLWAFGDTLEHLPKAEAFRILEASNAQCVVLAIPVGPWPQKPKRDNPFEEHKWSFYPWDLLSLTLWRVKHALIKGSKNRRREEYTDLAPRNVYDEKNEFIGNFLLERCYGKEA